MIDSKTKLLGVIGNPVGHSMSPAMYDAAFSKLGLDYVYLAFEVSDLRAAVGGMRALGVRGFNVTIPHKVDVVKYLDKVDETARMIGAVNTVVNEEGVLAGYNTDYVGAVDAILSKTGLEGKNVMVLGAGGAARAVAFGAAEKGASVVIVNRTKKRAMDLSLQLKGCFGGRVSCGTVEQLGDCDVLVNATSLGMYPDVGVSPLESKFLHKGMVVMDVVYNPVETRLLMDAKAVGCRTISGVDMLVNQAAEAFCLFTGMRAPKKVMREAVLGLL